MKVSRETGSEANFGFGRALICVLRIVQFSEISAHYLYKDTWEPEILLIDRGLYLFNSLKC